MHMKDNPTNFLAATKAEIGGQVVSQTLDNLNSPMYAGSGKKKGNSTRAAMSNTYELSKSVLSAAYEGKGTAIDKSS